MNITVTLDPASARAYRVRLDTAKAGVAKGLNRGILKAIIGLESFFKRDILHGGIVQSHTGNLSRSTFSRMESQFVGVVGWGREAPYAIFVNDGTRPHVIESTRASALRFAIGGNVIFRKRVNHPGNPPFRFAEQGLAQYRDTAVAAISEEVNRGMKEPSGG